MQRLSYTRSSDGAWMGLIDDVLIVPQETPPGVEFEVWCGEEKPVYKGVAQKLDEATQRVWCWLETESAVELFDLQA